MPQLDKVTFLSQFFWLCFFFLGFFYIILKFYLPKISRILALRRKKMGFSQEGMRSLQLENKQVRENYEVLLSKALVTSKTLFNNFFSSTTNWLNNHANTITQTHYQNVNKSYVHSLGETSFSQNLLFYHAKENFPEKFTFKVLLENLETLKDGGKSENLSSVKKLDTQEIKKKTKSKK